VIAQKIMFADGHWVHVEGSGAAVDQDADTLYLAVRRRPPGLGARGDRRRDAQRAGVDREEATGVIRRGEHDVGVRTPAPTAGVSFGAAVRRLKRAET
jgi:hypothetical protein